MSITDSEGASDDDGDDDDGDDDDGDGDFDDDEGVVVEVDEGEEEEEDDAARINDSSSAMLLDSTAEKKSRRVGVSGAALVERRAGVWDTSSTYAVVNICADSLSDIEGAAIICDSAEAEADAEEGEETRAEGGGDEDAAEVMRSDEEDGEDADESKGDEGDEGVSGAPKKRAEMSALEMRKRLGECDCRILVRVSALAS